MEASGLMMSSFRVFRSAIAHGIMLLGLVACAPQDEAPLVVAPPAAQLSSPAPGASVPEAMSQNPTASGAGMSRRMAR